MSFLDNQYFLLALTFIIYVASQLLQRRTGISMLNPILLSTVAIIVFLLVCDIDYDTYSKGGEFIDFWLKPAVVALGVPLYRQLESIKKQFMPILLAEVAGCIVGIASVVIVAQILGASREVVMSLASKSVTTPIAIEVTQAIGGIPALTAAVVVCTGILGTAAHAVGTSVAMETGYRYGAFSSLGLTINGLFTALLTPFILELLGYTL